MTPDQAVRAFYDRVWNRRDTAAIAELMHADVTFRGSLGPSMGGRAAFFAGYVDQVTGALADYRCTILDLVCEAERAFARLRFEGIHRGPFMGFPPTGGRVEWMGAALFTLRDGRIADLWVLGDVHGLLQRLAAAAED